MTDNIGNAAAASSQRLEYIDIAKGIGIFLVVIGHCVDRGGLPSIYIFSFHMPLFFILSGLCFNEKKYSDFLPFFKKRVRTLFLPLIYFSVILLLLTALVGNDFYTIENLSKGRFHCALWFICVLFFTELFYWFINHVFRQITIKIVILLFCLFIGVALDRWGILLPFSICTVWSATFFYGIGNMCRSNISKWLAHTPILGGGVLLLIPLLSAYYIHKPFRMIDNSFPSPAILTCTVALMGAVGVLVVSNTLTKVDKRIKNIMLYIGKNTLVIMCVHEFYIRLTYQFIEPYISSYLIAKTVDQIALWLMLLISIRLINARVPWLVGKSRAKA